MIISITVIKTTTDNHRHEVSAYGLTASYGLTMIKNTRDCYQLPLLFWLSWGGWVKQQPPSPRLPGKCLSYLFQLLHLESITDILKRPVLIWCECQICVPAAGTAGEANLICCVHVHFIKVHTWRITMCTFPISNNLSSLRKGSLWNEKNLMYECFHILFPHVLWMPLPLGALYGVVVCVQIYSLFG